MEGLYSSCTSVSVKVSVYEGKFFLSVTFNEV